MEALIYAAVPLIAVLFAIWRGHSVTFALRLEPKNRRSSKFPPSLPHPERHADATLARCSRRRARALGEWSGVVRAAGTQ